MGILTRISHPKQVRNTETQTYNVNEVVIFPKKIYIENRANKFIATVRHLHHVPKIESNQFF